MGLGLQVGRKHMQIKEFKHAQKNESKVLWYVNLYWKHMLMK